MKGSLKKWHLRQTLRRNKSWNWLGGGGVVQGSGRWESPTARAGNQKEEANLAAAKLLFLKLCLPFWRKRHSLSLVVKTPSKWIWWLTDSNLSFCLWVRTHAPGLTPDAFVCIIKGKAYLERINNFILRRRQVIILGIRLFAWIDNAAQDIFSNTQETSAPSDGWDAGRGRGKSPGTKNLRQIFVE